MKLKSLLTFAAGLLITVSADAVPALRKPIQVKQPNGSVITIIPNGDEFYHYLTTEDGIPVKLCSDNYYRYVCEDGVTVSSIIAKDPKDRTSQDLAFLSTNNKETIKKTYSAIQNKRSTAANADRTNVFKSVQEEEIANALVILVDFNDKKFIVSKDEIDNMLNQEGYSNYGSIGSAKEYFHYQSNGKFTMDFNVVGPIHLSNSSDYYGKNDEYEFDFRVPGMVKEACEIAAKEGLDFSKFDMDNDKKIDLVYIVYAGFGENANVDLPNLIWPHAHSLKTAGVNAVINGYTIDKYACSAELNDNRKLNPNNDPCGIGTFCHEFTHTLGLPDWYNTSTGGTAIIDWSLMDYGCYNNNSYVPIGLSAYEKEFIGWMEIEELKSPQTITLEPIIESKKAYKIVNENNPNEYIILENRIKKDWDEYMAAEGLMATAVSYDKNAWERNLVNIEKAKRYTILPADNAITVDGTKGDLYPYNGNNQISDYSQPSSITYSQNKMNKSISKITKNNDNSITFDFMGGDNYVSKQIVAKEATNVRDNQFIANWEKVEGISDYFIYISEKVNGQNINTKEYTAKDTDKILIRNQKTNTLYSYYVVGIDKEIGMLTPPSNEIEVALGTVGIDDESQEQEEIFAIDNQIIIDTNNSGIAEIYNTAGALIEKQEVQAGTTTLNINEPGLYIVRFNGKNAKLLIK